MREIGVGIEGKAYDIGNSINYKGITGVLTTATDKSGAGLMNDPISNGFIGVTDNDKWDCSVVDHYPELLVFSNADVATWGDERTAALVRAYSRSSTAGPQLETWDKVVDTENGNLIISSENPSTYDTTRDIVSGFPLTSNSIKKWDRIGTADSTGTIGMTSIIAGTSYPVLDLKHQNNKYICDKYTVLCLTRTEVLNSILMTPMVIKPVVQPHWMMLKTIFA